MADMNSTVEEGWITYLQKVLPVNCSPIQRRETKRAFYAGAWYLLQEFKNMPDDLSEDAGVAWLQARQDEMRRFYERVGQNAD